LGDKLAGGDPGAVAVAEYCNSSDFQAITDHMWKYIDFRQVRFGNVYGNRYLLYCDFAGLHVV
jgi:hypothetical protein